MFRFIANLCQRDQKPQTFRAPQQHAEKRRFGRIGCSMLRCRQGNVVNVSAGGMRVRCRRRPHVKVGQVGMVALELPMGYMDLPAQAIWTRRDEHHGHWEIGFAFGELSMTQRQALLQVARFAADREFVRPREAG